MAYTLGQWKFIVWICKCNILKTFVFIIIGFLTLVLLFVYTPTVYHVGKIPRFLTNQSDISQTIIRLSKLKWKSVESYATLAQRDHVTSKTTFGPHTDPVSPASTLNRPNETCTFPVQDPFHVSIMKQFHLFPTLSCKSGTPSMVYIEGNSLKLNTTKTHVHNMIIDYCHLVILRRNKTNDFLLEESLKPRIFTKVTEIPRDDDHFVTICYFKGRPVSTTYFSIIREKRVTEERCEKNYRRHIEENAPKETLSILLVGIDGMSRQSFIRSMNKTKHFLLNELNAIELFKFNQVAHSTFPNVVPLLSGKSKDEILEKWPSPSWRLMDNLDPIFIWTDYQKAGYRTAMTLDRTKITSFHYLKKGWKNPIFDYYNRPLVLKMEKDRLVRSRSKHCVGQSPEISLLFDNWLQLTTTFNNTKSKPYFGYSFFNRLTHESTIHASKADELYLSFLQNLHSRRVLNNTVLVFFSDHGPRFGKTRHTFSGILEARTPFMYFVFPEWLKVKYPKVMDNLRTNQHRLTTMFDVHATLKDLLYFQGTTGRGSLWSRGISLFHEIPAERNCTHAGIPSQFCMCSNYMTDVEDSPQLTNDVATTILKFVVDKTKTYRHICAELFLSSVETVASVAEDLRNGTAAKTVYRVIVKTKPNAAIYEGTVEIDNISKKSKVAGIPVRLNLYRGQAECIESESLRPFCYCKDKQTVNTGPIK